MAINDARGRAHDDPWLGEDRHDEKRQSIYELWNKVAEANKAWLEVVGIVQFEDILDIDDLGDKYVRAPHVYAPFAPGRRGPFKGYIFEVETIGQWDTAFHGEELTGRIRLGVPDDYAARYLTPVLLRFAPTHGAVEIELNCEQSTSLIPRVESGNLDLALVSRDHPRHGTLLFHEPMAWVGPLSFKYAGATRCP